MLSRPLVAATIKPIMLSILQDGEAYGYQIIQQIRRISGGKIEWTTGTLYPFLHRLETEGVVKSEWKEAVDAPKRKYYRLTAKGERALAKEKAQWLNANQILAGLWGRAALIPALDVPSAPQSGKTRHV